MCNDSLLQVVSFLSKFAFVVWIGFLIFGFSFFVQQASMLFSAIQQLPHLTVLSAMKSSMDALIQPGLLKHKDKDVRLLVTACISEIMRIVAPDAPYSDDILKVVHCLPSIQRGFGYYLFTKTLISGYGCRKFLS